MEIIKEHIKKSLLRLKYNQERYFKIRELGVDLINYDGNLTNVIEESIPLLINPEKPDDILQDIQWWLYEGVEKIVILKDETKIDLTDIDTYVNWLFDFYK